MRAIALSVLATLALSSCSALDQLDGPELAGSDLGKDVVRAVNRQAKKYDFSKAFKASSADCEDVQNIEKDAIADCTVTMGNGKEQYVRVTFQDEQGHFMVEQY